MVLDLSAAIVDLEHVASRISELAEWEKLAQQEHGSPFPSAFRPADTLREDILALYGWFFDLDGRVREVLSRPDLIVPSKELWDRWRERLEGLERQVRECRIHDRFINP